MSSSTASSSSCAASPRRGREKEVAPRPELSEEDTSHDPPRLHCDAQARLRLLRAFFAAHDKHKHDAEIVALWGAAAVASFLAAVLTEVYLRNVCACQ
jgi:hypothetical protein